MPDGRVRQQLARGARIREILRQPQHAPLRLVDEIALMLAVQVGVLDAMSLEAVAEFRTQLAAALDQNPTDILAVIETTDNLGTAENKALNEVIAQLAASLSEDNPAKGATRESTETGAP